MNPGLPAFDDSLCAVKQPCRDSQRTRLRGAQAFARLSAVYGGTYMLSKPDVQVVYDDAGKATGVTSEGETVQAKFVVGDPSALRTPSA